MLLQYKTVVIIINNHRFVFITMLSVRMLKKFREKGHSRMEEPRVTTTKGHTTSYSPQKITLNLRLQRTVLNLLHTAPHKAHQSGRDISTPFNSLWWYQQIIYFLIIQYLPLDICILMLCVCVLSN